MVRFLDTGLFQPSTELKHHENQPLFTSGTCDKVVFLDIQPIDSHNQTTALLHVHRTDNS